MAPQISMTLRTFAAEEPADWSHLVELAQLADEAGIDRLALSDHVAFGEDLEAYADPSKGGTRGGKQPTGPDGSWLEPLATIAHLTAVTRRVRFATNILIAALRRPVVLAKTASTIDVLSGGRLDLGVGVGWQREEYEAAGLAYERRGQLLDESLEVCQSLWRERVASHAGATLSFSDIHQMPKPRQAGGVPIWVSGTVNRRSMDRLARFGSGWIPWGDDAADVEAGIGRMREALAERGRDAADIAVVGSVRVAPGEDGSIDLDRAFERVGPLAAAGVTDFRLGIALPDDAGAARDLLGSVVEAFRRAA
jgi:probable F420-dependent oxidoreductase